MEFLNSESFEPRSYFMHVSGWNTIVRLRVVLNGTVVYHNWYFDNLCGSIFRVNVSCITSTSGIKLWLLTTLVNLVAVQTLI